MMVVVDFAPMPRRRTGLLARGLSVVADGVRRVEATRESHAAFWDEWNRDAAKTDGPLWVVLGDSTSQGIGAPDPLDGWVPQMRDRLRNETGEPWRVLNLSITGARLADVETIQLPRLAEIEAAGNRAQLITHLAGANDLMTLPRPFSLPPTLRRILDALPDHSVVGRIGVASPINSFMARHLTGIIESNAEQRPFHLFWPWDWPSRDGVGADGWHPGPTGYRYMTDLIWTPISASLAARGSG